MTDWIVLRNDRVVLTIGAEASGEAWIQSYVPIDVAGSAWRPAVRLPLVELSTADTGRLGLSTGLRQADGAIAHRLLLRSHALTRDGNCQLLMLRLADEISGLEADYRLGLVDGESTLDAKVTLVNRGDQDQLVTGLQTFTMTGFAHVSPDVRPWAGNLHAWIPYSGWLSECRWRWHTLEDLGIAEVVSPDHDLPGCMRRHVVSNTGTWSSSDFLPMGMIEDAAARLIWAWDIVHNGSWSWEVGDRQRDVYLAIGGPSDALHQWRRRLRPGDRFDSVQVRVAVTRGGFGEAVGALTETRRRARMPHSDNAEMRVVYNDFFNLWANPTTEKLLPVIAAAADVGAEVFCIDAGWHDEIEEWSDPHTEPVLGVTWWDAVGDWSPAERRFTHGLGHVLSTIRNLGMVPGLWMEPEVIGVRSPLLRDLPPEALFRRHGALVQDRGRYQLDFRHPAVTERLDNAVDRLVGDLGIGYLKIDYNIEGGTGTEVDADSPGDGLLQHNRAVLRWLEGIRSRHPELIIEGCASGGNRLDQAMLSLVPMQSTSDQKDPLLYAAVAANARSAVAPEQCGCWAIPEPRHDLDALGVTLCNAMLGRMLLSGRVQLLAPGQLAMVRAAVTVYKSLRADLARSLPVWPCGVPGWSDRWLISGARTPDRLLLSVWNRASTPGSVVVPAKGLQPDGAWSARPLFGSQLSPATVRPAASGDELVISFPGGPAACLVEVTRTRNGSPGRERRPQAGDREMLGPRP